MKAHNHPAYATAVNGYARQVASAEAPRTLENERRLGILLGVCLVLDLDPKGDAVKADIEIARAQHWTRWRV